MRRPAALVASALLVLMPFVAARLASAEPASDNPAARWAENGPGGAPQFTRHIVPLLGKQGCNNRACHGSFQGQNGFRLSLFGFEPDKDLAELLEDDGDGLRANVERPDESLVLLKPTNEDEHGGGLRLEPGSWQFRMFRAWICGGAKYDPDKDSKLVRFEVRPKEFVLKIGQTARPRAIACFSDGTSEDVTALTVFTTNDEGVAALDDDVVTAVRTGDTSIVAQYGGGVASTQVLVPFAGEGEFPPFPPHNPIDEHVAAKLQKLNVQPSPLCNDEVYLRRVYLDLIGTLPTADEARQFLEDRDPDKRARLVDALLERPEYATYWATKFSDWTGNGVYIFSDPTKPNWMWQLWLEDKLRRNVPYDELVYGFVCATSLDGRPREEFLAEAAEVMAKNEGRGNYDDGTYAQRRTLDLYWLKVQHRDPSTIALQTANAFLGIRLECAQCHNHPFDRWTKRDYEQFKSFFMLGRFCEPATGEEKRAGRRGYGSESLEPGVRDRYRTAIRRTPPKLLGGPEVGVAVREDGSDEAGEGDAVDSDARVALWKWMCDADNEFFAPALVNRLWAHYLGRGIVHPADDFNQGNPPSNPTLLAWLAEDFVQHGFDLKHVHRTILNSRTYQLSWRPNVSNRLDASNYSHALLRRLPAEVLIDAIAQVTGVPDRFERAPAGKGLRAIGQASPTGRHSINRMGYVMRVFGRPAREKTCDCERSAEPSVAQAMYLMNDAEVNAKLASPDGRLPQLLKETSDDARLIEELYLTALSRYPTAEELAAHHEHLASGISREAGMRDVLWSLLNVREFAFNH